MNNIRDFVAAKKEQDAMKRSGKIAAFVFFILAVIVFVSLVVFVIPLEAQSRIDPATQIQGGTQIVEWFDCYIPEGCEGLYQIMVKHPDGSKSGPYVIIQTLDGVDYARDEPERWMERDLK